MNDAQKTAFRFLATRFEINNNLFDLVAAMEIGAEILEAEDFPIKEWTKYKYKFKRYGKK